MAESESITVCITRAVKPGHEEAFERALHDFVQRSLTLPGQMGVHIMRPAPGSHSRNYGIIRKFANRDALAGFRVSPEYHEWSKSVNDYTEGEGKLEELCGLESWYTLSGEPLQPLPKWKMAIATLLGVYPTSLLIGEVAGPWIHPWPLLLRTLLFATLMVALLTWLVMPRITRILHPWLHPKQKETIP